MNYQIEPSALENIKKYQLSEDISFGKNIAPIMMICEYHEGSWGELKMVPYGKLELDPTCKVLHYGQEIFEGMKAYNVDGAGPFLFRPEENMKRFNFSARRMAMPEVPEEIFTKAVKEMTAHCAPFIPKNSGDSLYIRPFMYATENNLGIKPSEHFNFLVVASPSGAYFTGGTVSVLLEREAVRACPGGVGNAKTGGNYAASLLSMIEAKKIGYDQVLWLDALSKSNIEELSGMNFFAVVDDVLMTPKMTDTILEGITRKSIIDLAKHLGIAVKEETIKIQWLLDKIESGACSETFACGTAVAITPIHALGEKDGSHYPLPDNGHPIANKLRQALLDLQEGRGEDPFNWRVLVEAK